LPKSTQVAFPPKRADSNVVFDSREDAGRRLGSWLKERDLDVDLVLGLPRGGVVVAAEVAHVLGRPLDALIVRKIGHPLYREFAVGALAEGGVVVLDEGVVGNDSALRGQLAQVIEEEEERLKAYQSRFPHAELAGIASKVVLLVDDGLATGATTEAAVRAASKLGALKVIVSAPVGSTHAVERLQRVADRVEVMIVDPAFEAVGRYYDNFPQTTDDEVLGLLLAT
jgi:putative phosphoribosyl transferase